FATFLRHAPATPGSTPFPYTTLFRSLEWVRRADGYGFEIKGISQELMAEFSSRRKTISAHVAQAAQQYEREHGRAPSQTMLNRIDRKSTRLNSSHLGISYAVFCLKKK